MLEILRPLALIICIAHLLTLLGPWQYFNTEVYLAKQLLGAGRVRYATDLATQLHTFPHLSSWRRAPATAFRVDKHKRSMLCTRCLSVLEGLGNGDASQTRPLHDTFLSLQDSAHSGCYVCSSIHDHILEECSSSGAIARLKERCMMVVSLDSLGGDADDAHLRRMIVQRTDEPVSGTDIWRYLLIPLSNDREDFGFGVEESPPGRINALHEHHPLIPPSTDATEVLDLTYHWYQDCKHQHRQCRPEAGVDSKKFYPPRLLDVTQSPLCLVSKDLVDKSHDYAALSHCWGQESFLTLTADLLPVFERAGIPLNDLPENFQNAVKICRSLRIKYLWIDSLCIIQSGSGSLEDWSIHVHLMKNIYAFSDLCIATAAASKATESTFSTRNPARITPATVNVQLLYSTTRPLPHLVLGEYHALRGHRNAPLASRAWALQERLLSPRIVIFARQQVFWECCETMDQIFCETFPSGVQGQGVYLSKRGPFSLPKTRGNFTSDQHDISLRLTWLDLIETYCECDLTRPNEDKFAAFAGIAAGMAIDIKQPQYIAGFFRDEMPTCLLWYVRAEAVPDSYPRPSNSLYRAPTWSWAATDAPINFWRPCSGPYIEMSNLYFAILKQHRVELAKDWDPFGQIRYAELVLEAPLIPFPLLGHNGHPRFVQRQFYFDSNEDAESQAPMFLMPIHGDDCSWFNYRVSGLIVQREVPCSIALANATGPREYYKRIGSAFIDDEEFLATTKTAPRQHVTLL